MMHKAARIMPGVSNFLINCRDNDDGGGGNDEEKEEVLVIQSCLTLCDPMDYSLPGSSVHGILQARILEWVAISFSKG